jgi:hypothetical protein
LDHTAESARLLEIATEHALLFLSLAESARLLRRRLDRSTRTGHVTACATVALLRLLAEIATL